MISNGCFMHMTMATCKIKYLQNIHKDVLVCYFTCNHLKMYEVSIHTAHRTNRCGSIRTACLAIQIDAVFVLRVK